VIERLRASIAAGHPWLHEKSNERFEDQFDLLGLVSGHWYGFSHFIDENDDDSIRELWETLRDEILTEHAKRRPGTRPSAWWRWEALELRRVLRRACINPEHDDDCDGGHDNDDDGRLPASEDPNLPEWCKETSLGVPHVYDGYVYESQRIYLERLRLLTPIEKSIFEKYGDIVFARISSGECGKCESCWTEARKTATGIDFDLGAAVLQFDTFWLPAQPGF
jgi:hypothetical protein